MNNIETIELISGGIAKTPPPPCVGCEHFNKCKDELLSCGAFNYYASMPIPRNARRISVHNRVREPHKKWYTRLFHCTTMAKDTRYSYKLKEEPAADVDPFLNPFIDYVMGLTTANQARTLQSDNGEQHDHL